MKLKDFILIALINALLLWFFRSEGRVIHNETIEHHYIDTVDNYKIIEPIISIPKPKIVYVDTGSLKVIHDTIMGVAVNKYEDSIVDTNYKFFYSALVDGELLDLKVKHTSLDRVITDVRRITNMKVFNSIDLTLGAGGNSQTFNNISLGARFNHKQGYAFGYNYNTLQNTHNIELSRRLIKW